MAQASPRSPAFQAAMVGIEWFGILAFVGLSLALGIAVLGGAAQSPWLLLPLVLTVPLGLIIADLGTGFGHYFADNFCS